MDWKSIELLEKSLTENAPNSIINNIRILDVGPPITNAQASTEAYIRKLQPCTGRDAEMSLKMCTTWSKCRITLLHNYS